MASPAEGTKPSMKRLLQSASVQALKRENELWAQLKSTMDTMKTQMVRVKAEGAKETFERATRIIASLEKAREDMTMEWRSKIDAAGRSAEPLDTKFEKRVDALESKVLGALNAVQSRLTEQDSVLASFANHPAPARSTE